MKKSAIEDKRADDTSLEETCMLAIQTEKGWYMTGSKYIKTIRTMAWILRFINNCQTSRTARTIDELSAKEFIAAELVVLKLSQHESFNGDKDPKLKHFEYIRR